MKRILLFALGVWGTGCLAPPESPPLAAIRSLEAYFPGDERIPWVEVGRSMEGRAIYAARFGSGPELTLILGGVHGDETTSILVSIQFCREVSRFEALLAGRRVLVVPILNPDGFVRGRRQNARNVDLNRNLPTRNWGDGSLRPQDHPGRSPGSESETQVAMRLIRKYRPDKILSLHSPLRVNNYDGAQSERLARKMAVFNRYPVKGYIGYPTPGSLGTWAGVERKIPMVTLEIPGGALHRRWEENRWALVAAVRFDVSKS